MGIFSDILLTVDFDRTMTATDSTVPERNLEAVRYFTENGGAFTLNTGRSIPMANRFLETIPVNVPFLLYNGSAAYDKETGKIKADLICLVDEVFDENEPLLLFDPAEPWKKTKLAPGSYTLREILVPIFKNGQCVYESPKVMEIREYCNREKDTLWDETKRFINPHKVYVDLSKKLYDIKIQLLDQMSEK
jgi:hypothetical protein